MPRVRSCARALAAALVALVACGAPPGPPAPGAPAEVTVAQAHPLGGYNPVAGYGVSGDGLLYDGLLRVTGGGALPELAPSLAAELPAASANSTVWTVRLREGVAFSDGSALDAADVAATYRAILDPQSASPARASFTMIRTVEAVDGHTVRFTLRHPYLAFPTRLLVGIAPAEALREAGPAAQSPLNSAPVGTGPYRLATLTPGRAVFEARPDHWAGAPAVARLTVLHLPDDELRAQALESGQVDGAALPPRAADAFAGRRGFTVAAHPSADWRAVTLPSGHPVTGDRAVRLALNLAANRPALVEAVLAGHGAPAYTPVSEAYRGSYNRDAWFLHNPDRARSILDAAGWAVGPDGVRARGGQRAEFTLVYPAADSVRRGLAEAFAADALAVGVRVAVEAVPWEALAGRSNTDAVLLGGGEEPYDPDTLCHRALHSDDAGGEGAGGESAGGLGDNPGGYRNARVDAALDTGRTSTNPAERAAAYRELQTAFVEDPGLVFLVFTEHTSVVRDTGWRTSGPVFEPHPHGELWGPWWSLRTWSRS